MNVGIDLDRRGVACDAREQSSAHRGVEPELRTGWYVRGGFREPQAAPLRGYIRAVKELRPLSIGGTPI